MTPDDAVEVVPLLEVLGYPSTVAQCRDRLERTLSQPDCAAWCVRADAIVGVAAGRRHWALQVDDPVAELIALAVAPSHSCRGVGRVLLDAFETWAAHHGCRRLKVTSGSHRADAHAFYEHCGYELSGVRFHKYVAASEDPGDPALSCRGERRRPGKPHSAAAVA